MEKEETMEERVDREMCLSKQLLGDVREDVVFKCFFCARELLVSGFLSRVTRKGCGVCKYCSGEGS